MTVHIKWKGYWRFSTNISLYFENGTRYGHSYNRRRIGTPTRSIECVILGVRPAPDHPHCLIEIKFGMRGSTPDVDWVFFSEPRRVKNRFSTMQSIQGHGLQYTTLQLLATTNMSFILLSLCITASHLWNQLPVPFRQSTNQFPSHSPHFTHGSSCTSSSFLPP